MIPRLPGHRMIFAALALAAGLGLGLSLAALPAAAETYTATITQEVTCGGGQTGVKLGVDQTPGAVAFSPSAQNTNARLRLRAGMHGGCAQDGWAVTLVASNMVAPGIGSISADNVRAVSLSSVTRESGQPKLPVPGSVNNTPVNSPVVVMRAEPKTGNGISSQEIGLQLVIPGYTLPGSYATTVTATIAFGPS